VATANARHAPSTAQSAEAASKLTDVKTAGTI
jgi:hypothetical protein